MSKIFSLSIFFTAMILSSSAQETIYPAKANAGTYFITGGTIHIGNGQVISNGTIEVNGSKIVRVGPGIIPPAGGKLINASGQHIYPGIILSNSDLGLKEISSQVRGSNDYNELGDLNPSIRSIVAYNTDSKIINTLRSNGVLLVNIVPQDATPSRVLRQLLTGSSSVVQLDAWTYEDAAYRLDGHMHLNLPSLVSSGPRITGQGGQPLPDPVKTALDNIERVKNFLREAKSYLAETTHKEINLKFEALKRLFDKKQKFFIHCNAVREMLVAIDFVSEFGFDVVIVGGNDSWQIAALLKQNNIPVILNGMHNLPVSTDDDVDQNFKTPYLLKKAGVLFAINDYKEDTRGKNIMFNAGTAVAYGLTKEEAITAITLDAAKILGISDITGSIEVGKDANIVISAGDILDMRSSVVTKAFIQGREISLENKHTQLYERYKHKYGL